MKARVDGAESGHIWLVSRLHGRKAVLGLISVDRTEKWRLIVGWRRIVVEESDVEKAAPRKLIEGLCTRDETAQMCFS